MGNRTERGGHPLVINPNLNPYLHIVSSDGGRSYEYVASLYGILLKIGKTNLSNKGYEYVPFESLHIPLLPPPTKIPPDQIDTEELVTERIGSYAENILSIIETHPDSNIIASSHGVYWDFLPEQAIAELLKNNGYDVTVAFPRTGGRKRIQEHGILFRR